LYIENHEHTMARQPYSAAAAWLAHLKVYSFAILKVNVNVVVPPLVFCPSRLLSIQHYVGSEPVHGYLGVQMCVQVIQGSLHVASMVKSSRETCRLQV